MGGGESMTGSERDPFADRVARDVLDNLVEGCQVIGFDWEYLYVNDSWPWVSESASLRG